MKIHAHIITAVFFFSTLWGTATLGTPTQTLCDAKRDLGLLLALLSDRHQQRNAALRWKVQIEFNRIVDNLNALALPSDQANLDFELERIRGIDLAVAKDRLAERRNVLNYFTLSNPNNRNLRIVLEDASEIANALDEELAKERPRVSFLFQKLENRLASSEAKLIESEVTLKSRAPSIEVRLQWLRADIEHAESTLDRIITTFFPSAAQAAAPAREPVPEHRAGLEAYFPFHLLVLLALFGSG